jgi:hypothetical protein
MPYHFADFVSVAGCPGVFLVKQSTPIAAVIDSLILIWSASDENDWRNRILEVPL